jgi:aminoglycoside phosphotransferase (APT) family kinase protein
MPHDKHQIDRPETPSPDERHKEFSEENGRWNKEMEDALTELDELADEPDASEPAPA